MKEIWLDIPNYNGYQVSNTGLVRTHNKATRTKLRGERQWKDRILVPKGEKGKNVYKTGYRVDLWKEGRPYTFLVARLVAYTFFGEDINDHSKTVNHKDGNRLNNRLDNLEIISLADNIRHAFDTGLHRNQKHIRVRNLLNDTEREYMSMAKASEAIGVSKGFISSKLKKNKHQHKYYVFEVVD